MPHDPRKSLRDVRDAIRTLRNFTNAVTFDGYVGDLKLKLAVERLFLIVGEAIVRVRDANADLLDEIGHTRQIVAFRNIIAHGYDIVSDKTVWSIIQVDVPQLEADVVALLTRLGGDDGATSQQ